VREVAVSLTWWRGAGGCRGERVRAQVRVTSSLGHLYHSAHHIVTAPAQVFNAPPHAHVNY